MADTPNIPNIAQTAQQSIENSMSKIKEMSEATSITLITMLTFIVIIITLMYYTNALVSFLFIIYGLNLQNYSLCTQLRFTKFTEQCRLTEQNV